MSNASRGKQRRALARHFNEGAVFGSRVIAADNPANALDVVTLLEGPGSVYTQLPGGVPQPVHTVRGGVPVLIVLGDAPMHRVRTLHRAWPDPWRDEDMAPVIVLERAVTVSDMILRRQPAGVDVPGVPVTVMLGGVARDLGTGEWLVRAADGPWDFVDPEEARAILEQGVRCRVAAVAPWGGAAQCDVLDERPARWWADTLRCPVALVRSAHEFGAVAR